MPRRTNDFQAIVYFIKRYLAPNATVLESALLEDRLTGGPREVDVLVTGDVGGHTLAVGIEVRDHNRRQGVEWVEQVHGKHSRLPVNQTVLVSRSGFTKPAVDLAARYGIELVTPGEPINPDGPLGDLRVQVEFKEVQSLGGLEITALLEGVEAPVPLKFGHFLYTDDGDQIERVGDWAIKKRQDADMAEAVAAAEAGQAFLVVMTDFDDVNVPPGSSLLHLKQADSDELIAIRKLQAVFSISVTISQVPLRWLRMQTGEFGVGEGMFMGARALVVATDDPETRQSYIRLTDAAGNVIDLDPENRSEAFLDAEGVARMRERGLNPGDRDRNETHPDDCEA